MIALTSPFANALAWALVHFLWQGAAIALIVFALWRLLPLTAAARYRIGVSALAAMLIAPCVTTLWLIERQPSPVVTGATLTAASGAIPAPRQIDVLPTTSSVPAAAPIGSSTSRFGLLAVLAVWFSGVILLSIRLVGGWFVARRLVHRNVGPVPHAVEVVARRVAARLAVDRVVRVLESSSVTVPMMVGWARPVVLMPAAALIGLSPVQIEALIAHELAHVRRMDYLVNLIQSAVEILLFYHPAVWWLSREVRMEREHCCDDLAVEVCDRLEYVTALTTLASMATPRLALAATDGSLVRRVRRILGQGSPEQGAATGWIAAMLGVLILAGASVTLTTARERDREAAAAMSEAVLQQAPSGGRTASETPKEVVPEEQRSRPVEVAEAAREVAPDLVQVYERAVGRYGELTKAQQAEAERAAARLQEAAEALRHLAKEQTELRLKAATRETQSAIQNLERDLAALQIEHTRLQRNVEVGLLGKEAVQENAVRIAATQQKIGDLKAALDLRQQEILLELRRLDAEQQREMALEALAKAQEERVYGEQGRDAERAVQDMQRRALEALVKQHKAEEGTTLTDPAATARAGDVIDVSIDGEPDLPPSYVVQENGSIRLPLLDPIKVAGLTTSQIASAIRKQLSRVSTKVELEVGIRRR